MSLNIVEGNKIGLTQPEVDYLENVLFSGNRTAFYIAYYNMTGNEEAIIQAKISSFSDSVGGIAYLANSFLQNSFDEYRIRKWRRAGSSGSKCDRPAF